MIDATQEIIRGLEDVLVAETAISLVDGEQGRLTYRGYNIFDLAEHSTFEETTYLLFYGQLPTKEQALQFERQLAGARALPTPILQILRELPKQSHPMAQLRTAIAAYGCFDPEADVVTEASFRAIGAKLIAQVGTMAAAIWRLSRGWEPVAPDPTLSYAANFLYMLQGQKPTPEAARIMDISLICHADHELPASTFSSLVVCSSLTDLYSSIAAAVGSLKGPLHGGANEQTLRNFDAISGVENVGAYMAQVKEKKLKVPGIGHRVYKAYDPRAVIFKRIAEQLAKQHPALTKTYATAVELERQCVELFGAKKLFPNVDYFSGIVYRSLGIDPLMFTPIFAVSRMAGWVSHLIEYLPQNRIFRPAGKYVGPAERAFVPTAERK